jgi:hypothetical protein
MRSRARLLVFIACLLCAQVAFAQTAPTGTGGAGGGGGTPGGTNTQCQYNNNGAFGGITNCTSNGTTATLTSPAFAGTATGTYTLGGTPTVAGPTFTGTVSGTPTWASSQTLPGLQVTGSTTGIQAGAPTGGDQGLGTVNAATNYFLNGALISPLSVLANAGAYAAITNTATETLFAIAGDGKIPAGLINATKHSLAITLRGIISTTSTATVTLRVKLCTVSGCGSGTVTPIAVTGAVAPGAAVTNQGWWASVDCNVATAGTSGTLTCAGFAFYSLTGLTALQADDMVNTGTVTINTTVDEYVSASIQYNETSTTDTDTLQVFRTVVY